jgi:hypothetical protein
MQKIYSGYNKFSDALHYVYILELNGGNYYIGKTANIASRFNDHKCGKGSAWTRIHGGCKMIEIHPCESLFDEDKHTLDFMDMFGLDKVRGGSFSNVVLTEEQKNVITKSMRNANGSCEGCGEYGHFINNCTTSLEKSKHINKTTEVSEGNEDTCKRCFRSNHTVENCYAKTTINGKII